VSESWWVLNPKRLLSEVNQLNALVASDNAFTLDKPMFKDGEMIVTGSLKVQDEEKKFRLTFPALFPLVCPSLKPQEKERWSSHQYGEGGSVCLEIGPDNWDHTKFSGKDFLVSLKQLIASELTKTDAKPEVPSRHQETEGQKIRNEYLRFVKPSFGIESQGKPTHGACVVASNITTDTGILWISEFPKGTTVTMPHGMARSSSFNRDVQYYILKNPGIAGITSKALVTVPSFVRYMIADQLGEDEAKKFDAVEDGKLLLFIFEDSDPILARSSKDEEQFRLKVVPSVSFENHDRTDPKVLEAFANLKVSIIGLGSVGSKVAVSLARIGVRDFVLVDDEILEFGNIVRHEATLADVSAHKVDMVADLIHNICPIEPTIKREFTRIGGQENPARYNLVIKNFMSSDVIIDCTASSDVFQILSALCTVDKKPMVWGEVFAGGIGGIAACADPRYTPAPSLIRHALNDYLSVQPNAPFKLETARYEGGTLIADDNSVALLANMMVYRVKQLILQQYDNAESPCWIVGFLKSWIFNLPFEVKKVPCRPEDYPLAVPWGKIEPDFNLSAAEQFQLDQLFSKQQATENAT
jgi:molybdopterin/thiamine biosynthesis adenylyltransferase/ubiquitin-protein ligase